MLLLGLLTIRWTSRNRIEFAYSVLLKCITKATVLFLAGWLKGGDTLKSAQGNRSGIVCEIRISSIFLLWIIKPTTSCPGEILEKSVTKSEIQFGSGKIIFIIILFFFNYAKIPRKPTVYFHAAFAKIGSSTNKLSDHFFHLLVVKLNNFDIYDTKYVNHYIRQSTANSQTNVQHRVPYLLLPHVILWVLLAQCYLSLLLFFCLKLLGCPKSAHFICTIIWLLAVDNLKMWFTDHVFGALCGYI